MKLNYTLVSQAYDQNRNSLIGYCIRFSWGGDMVWLNFVPCSVFVME